MITILHISTGPGDFDFTQGQTKGSRFWQFVSSFLKSPSQAQKDCHFPKPILLDTGEVQRPYAWWGLHVCYFYTLLDSVLWNTVWFRTVVSFYVSPSYTWGYLLHWVYFNLWLWSLFEPQAAFHCGPAASPHWKLDHSLCAWRVYHHVWPKATRVSAWQISFSRRYWCASCNSWID